MTSMFVASRVAAIAICLLLPGIAAAGENPNVVLVTLDLGDQEATGLEKLKEESTCLSEVIGSSFPAGLHAELLSGTHAFRCGVVSSLGGRNWIRPESALLPELMRASGYRTAMVGTWYFGDNLPLRPEDRGFDQVEVHGSGGLGSLADRWGNQTINPWMRTRGGWVTTTGAAEDVLITGAIHWLSDAKDERPIFLHLSLGRTIHPKAAKLTDLLAEMDRLKLSEKTLIIVQMMGSKGTGPIFFRWPGHVIAGKNLTNHASSMDVYPTIVGFTGIKHFVDWKGDGVDLSEALEGKGEFPSNRLLAEHPGNWPAGEHPDRYRNSGYGIQDDRWKLEGTDLYDLKEDPKGTTNVFEKNPQEVTRLLTAYGKWWQGVRTSLLEPVRVRVGDARQPVVKLSAMDWWPSNETLEADSAASCGTQEQVRALLDRLAVPDEARKMRSIAGRWRLQVAQTGHYRVTLSKVPNEMAKEDREKLAPLAAGTIHVRSGKYEEKAKGGKGVTAISLGVDLNEGPADLEAWFENQMGEKQILGAFFISIERIGERKMPDPDWKPQKK